MPDLALERECDGIVCGIDEAGRGPLAGPVVAAAVIIDAVRMPHGLRRQIDDSKKLRREAREDYAARLWSCARIGIGAASVGEIDRINILQASLLAMRRALEALPAVPHWALVDGNVTPQLPCRTRTVVGGDALSLSIAAASIIAKVTRDRLMRALACRYPGYGWETNVGYATEEHRAGLLALGPTRHHRLSFAPVQLSLVFESNPNESH
ncbi:MAG: ribonuclease HII [Alphaproteobacteria bacterium]|nr:ribonuclease HII [Alphaproteobacteria bacterium]MDE1930215.1 ribonuclease HII [Alphaproteobacteria bacterium]